VQCSALEKGLLAAAIVAADVPLQGAAKALDEQDQLEDTFVQAQELFADSVQLLSPPTQDDDKTVQFFSVKHSCLTVPTAELAAQQQRIKQLPTALESNTAAMATAEVSGELADLGALYLERKRLEQELKRMQSGPLAPDVIEVRYCMRLPLGVVTVDGRLYCVQRDDESGSVVDRQIAAVQLHFAGHFSADPFGENDAGGMCPGSEIFTRDHTLALLRLFDGQRPSMQLLYHNKRHGMTTAAFHRCCDGKGPTLTVIRTRPSDGSAGRIIGGWAGESWNSSAQQYAAATWLFSLGSVNTAGPAAQVSKYRALSTAAGQAMRSHSSYGPMFGPNGDTLEVSRSMVEVKISASLQGYQLQAGYTMPAGGLLGGAVDSTRCGLARCRASSNNLNRCP